MRTIHIYLSICIAISLAWTDPITLNFCSLINRAKSIKPTKFYPSYGEKINATSATQLLTSESSALLYGDEGSTLRSYLVGKFKISKQRTGLISFNKDIVADRPLSFFTLHIFDSCSLKTTITISENDIESVYYEKTTVFNATFDTIMTEVRRSSDWAVVTGNMDTIFTDRYKISLASLNVDTISKSTTFELVDK